MTFSNYRDCDARKNIDHQFSMERRQNHEEINPIDVNGWIRWFFDARACIILWINLGKSVMCKGFERG